MNAGLPTPDRGVPTPDRGVPTARDPFGGGGQRE